MTVRLALADGRLRFVDAKGRPLPPERRITTTAGALTGTIDAAIAAAFAAGAEQGAAAGHTAGISQSAEAWAKVVQDAAAVYHRAGVEAGAKAGVKAGVKHAYATSRFESRTIRDQDGQVVTTVMERVPIQPPPERPAAK